jgi:hypothetical protein
MKELPDTGQNVKECDPTMFDSSNIAGSQILHIICPVFAAIFILLQVSQLCQTL